MSIVVGVVAAPSVSGCDSIAAVPMSRKLRFATRQQMDVTVSEMDSPVMRAGCTVLTKMI
jgi:hypothetical protein